MASPVALKCLLFLAAVVHGKAAAQRLAAWSSRTTSDRQWDRRR